MSATLARQPVAASSVIPLPSFFNPKNAEVWGYSPDLLKVFNEAHDFGKRYGVRQASRDSKNVHLLLIDVQKDFCFPQGTLYVGGRSGTGAIDDSKRIAQFIYGNIGEITEITETFDTHIAYQIFFPSFWLDQNDNPVQPHTVISMQDLNTGKFRVSPKAAAALGYPYAWLTSQVNHYCEQLELDGKYKLYIWPFHCILGTDGHALVGVVEEACKFHAFLRGMKSKAEIKGAHPLTENYSVLRPEVVTRHDGQGSLGQKNARFIETLTKADRVIIGGQAASHCVKSTIADLLTEIKAKDPALAKKVYLLSDCMSAVAVPNPQGGFFADYTDDAEKALKEFSDAGMNVVKSTDAIDTWKDF